ncbi:microtubule associated-domain-containing protein [Lipomyces arxii]|uniref:microtubule associated-domain-containing protein n=1 Tax=Lipomyces arxii TaxID=56418 RepID=UPI0034CEF2F0
MPTGSRDRTETKTVVFDDADLSLLNREASFVAPVSSKLVLSKSASDSKLQQTPARRAVFTNLTNQQGMFNEREFTPVLQSAFRGGRKTNMTGLNMQEPQIPKNSPGLPQNAADEDFSASMEDITQTSMQQPNRLASETSTPVPTRGSSGENMLTLREQEKAIDEINKENFGLKLRIYFLMQQLKAGSPEELSGTLQQNVEMKAEQVRMRSELAQLRKQLNESQTKVNHLTTNIAEDLSNHNELTEDQKMRLAELLEDKRRANDNLIDARAEIDRLQEEVQEYKTQLEQTDVGDSDADDMRSKIESLESELEVLTEENVTLTSKLEATEDELKKMTERLKEAELQIEELQDTVESLQSDEHEGSNQKPIDSEAFKLQQQIQELTAELEQARAQAMAEMERTDKAEKTIKSLELKNTALEQSRQELQSRVEQAHKNNETTKLSKFESNDLADPDLNGTLLELQEEVITLEKALDKKDGTIEELRREIASLQVSSTDSRKAGMYQKQIEDEVEQKQGAIHKIAALTKQNKSLDSQLKALKQSSREREEAIKDLQDRLERADDEIAGRDDSAREISTLRTQLVRVQDERDRLVSAIQRLRIEQDSSVKQLDKLADQAQITRLKKQHQAELKGMVMQIQYLRAKNVREHGLRLDLTFMKRFFLLQINNFESCNQANLYMLEQMGIYPEKKHRDKRPTLKVVGHMIIAAIRLRNMKNEAAAQQKLRLTLAKSIRTLKEEKRRK